MYQIIFQNQFITLRSYGLMIALGIILGAALALWLSRDREKLMELLLDFLPWAIVAGLVGARLWEVAFSWEYFAPRPLEILYFWAGGLSVQGAVLGGTLAAIWFCRRRRISFRWFVDNLVPGLLLGQAIGRVGCFLNGCCFGIPTNSSLGVRFPEGTDAYAAFGSQALWPTQLFEAGWDILVLIVIIILGRRHYRGESFVVFLALYSIGRFLLEFLRGDSLQFLIFRSAQATSVIAVLLAIGLHLYWSKKQDSLQ